MLVTQDSANPAALITAQFAQHPHLSRADVAGCLVTPDVLLACLHGHAQGWLALCVNAHTNDAAGQQALVLIVAGQEGSVGATCKIESRSQLLSFVTWPEVELM